MGLWSFVSVIQALLSTIFPIILIFLVFKDDLGKNHVHYSIYTPQSIITWIVPKMLFVFLVQGLFAILILTTATLLLDIQNAPNIFDSMGNKIISLLQSTFMLGYFGIIALAMALYYSFRNKKFAWLYIGVSIVAYMIATALPTVIMIIKEGEEAMLAQGRDFMLLEWGTDVVVGAIYTAIAVYLFDKRIEY